METLAYTFYLNMRDIFREGFLQILDSWTLQKDLCKIMAYGNAEEEHVVKDWNIKLRYTIALTRCGIYLQNDNGAIS